MANILDIFRTDAFFNVTSLTEAVNNRPYAPGRVTALGLFDERGVPTTSITIEEQDGVVGLVQSTPRGAPPVQHTHNKRRGRQLLIPHIAIEDAIYADEVQGVRTFGSDSQVQGVRAVANDRLDEMARKLDVTLEFQRLGALKGLILDADGSTMLDLFAAFGVSQEAEVAFDLTNAANGALRKTCNAIARKMRDNLGGDVLGGIRVFCDSAFFDDLIANPEVRATVLFDSTAATLRQGNVNGYPIGAGGVLNFGGITFEEYRGNVSGQAFVAADKCVIFPDSTPGLFKTYFAPADYVETVNTIGLPRYARQYDRPDGKAIIMESQTNPLPLCLKPKVLMKGKRGA